MPSFSLIAPSLRALKKIDARAGCTRERLVAALRCLRVNNEDFCQ
jgi:hypothetical protein